ncbi:MAG: SusF/SusE family outer membrane protein [Candidatus Symbiothrix sp.]|jgi:hypothetical protein|nr:SusF/SusE family outer membrane protein [Candidatus Symbiothrix sp.]
MKKILNIIIAMICVTGLFTACETERDNPVLNASATKPAITSTLPASIVIVAENLESEYATVTYHPAVYSIAVPVTNQLQLSLSNNFQDNNTTSVGAATSEKSIALTNKVLNSAIVAIGGETLKPNTAWFRIKSAVSASTGSPETELFVSYSDPVQVTITPYEPQPTWIYSPGAYQGWDPATSQALCSLTDNGIYIGYINFPEADSEFKFTQEKSWDVNWGSDDGHTLAPNAGNIKSPDAGYYKITVNLNAMEFAMEAYSWGVIGSASPGGWDTDTNMDWNAATQRWESTVTLTAGEIKFRLNHDWGTNYGGSGLSGDAVAGGDNIAITEAGTYFVIFDVTNLTYSVTKK